MLQDCEKFFVATAPCTLTFLPSSSPIMPHVDDSHRSSSHSTLNHDLSEEQQTMTVDADSKWPVYLDGRVTDRLPCCWTLNVNRSRQRLRSKTEVRTTTLSGQWDKITSSECVIHYIMGNAGPSWLKWQSVHSNTHCRTFQRMLGATYLLPCGSGRSCRASDWPCQTASGRRSGSLQAQQHLPRSSSARAWGRCNQRAKRPFPATCHCGSSRWHDPPPEGGQEGREQGHSWGTWGICIVIN